MVPMSLSKNIKFLLSFLGLDGLAKYIIAKTQPKLEFVYPRFLKLRGAFSWVRIDKIWC